MNKKIPFFIILNLAAFLLGFGSMKVLAYSTSIYKWSSGSVNYFINNAFAASFVSAMQSADSAWDAVGAKFKFNYNGTTSRNPNVFSYFSDGKSDIGYFNKGNNGIIATTNGFVYGGTAIFYEHDITLNIYYGFTTIGAANKYDVQNVITHEFGHWLRLLDLYSGSGPSFCGTSFESTMCGIISSTGETRKRTLENDDKAGMIAIYGT